MSGSNKIYLIFYYQFLNVIYVLKALDNILDVRLPQPEIKCENTSCMLFSENTPFQIPQPEIRPPPPTVHLFPLLLLSVFRVSPRVGFYGVWEVNCQFCCFRDDLFDNGFGKNGYGENRRIFVLKI